MGNKCCTKGSNSHVLDTQNDLRTMKNNKRNDKRSNRSTVSNSRNSTTVIKKSDDTGSEAELDVKNINKQNLQMDVAL